MEVFITSCLSGCLFVFLVMACVNFIGMEKRIQEIVDITEEKVKNLYQVQ